MPPGTEPQLAEALAETLRRPGNLLRAELAFQVGQMYGMEDHAAEQLAIGLEYFHTASLLFDDLPSMDNALHRRGAICVHQRFGEGAAILSALALVNRAYALLWSAMDGQPAAYRKQAQDVLERYLGLSGVLNGQSHDIHQPRPLLAHPAAAPKPAQHIALEKTVSLIRLPMVLPAILGGASAAECALLHRLATFWGLGYQGLDDLKDVLRAGRESGKTTGRDALLARPNLALEQGTEATVVRLQRLTALAERVVRRLLGQRPQFEFLQNFNDRFAAELRATVEDCEHWPTQNVAVRLL